MANKVLKVLLVPKVLTVLLVLYFIPSLAWAPPGSYSGYTEESGHYYSDDFDVGYFMVYLVVLGYLVYAKLKHFDYEGLPLILIPFIASLLTGMIVVIGIYAIIGFPVYYLWKWLFGGKNS